MKEDIDVTLRILTAYLNQNQVAKDDMLMAIAEIHNTVKQVFYTQPIEDSIKCLCCGKRMKTLRKHLRTKHNLSIEEYKKQFKLEGEVRMVVGK